ncbi:hypothetical protein [Chromobacterium vaccinii]|uniref:Uncharacterized protein n=1 Tax=Chromobacterium vaccinii TaxID=1108595 RepID=A0A1D9LM59_9NEIS|nr:hypothetical protein [Chromobacterium vaccinii]AOZ52319.1 hypothetical protein BKX93_21475 [Chromobacterium vaccinii]QND85999.1 Uncharacterized protein ChrSW_3773 [Chromobacterium vaccinii]QND91230.1 Uncharacterized protein ChrSV_3773 [Chromobacterium vaccinii]SUX56412.1 Uncharacterised protein [Chromobacterium vaccinii]
MDVLHSTWFWLAVIAAPAILVIGTLARLARREPPVKLPPGVKPLGWDEEDDVPEKLHDGDREPPKH